MPQIWPMNWVLLFVYFLLTFILFIATLYFTSSVKLPAKTLQVGVSAKNSLFWLW